MCKIFFSTHSAIRLQSGAKACKRRVKCFTHVFQGTVTWPEYLLRGPILHGRSNCYVGGVSFTWAEYLLRGPNNGYVGGVTVTWAEYLLRGPILRGPWVE